MYRWYFCAVLLVAQSKREKQQICCDQEARFKNEKNGGSLISHALAYLDDARMILSKGRFEHAYVSVQLAMEELAR